MDFLHPLLALGAATFAIPVVLHLIFRMRKRRIVFSSLRFLQQSLLKESKRLRLRELLLLLLRCLACILVALAFARPFRADSALAGPNGRVAQDVMLVLDDSPSMNAQEGAGTRWQNALKDAREEVAARAAGDRAGLVLGSEPARAEVELAGNFANVSGALNTARVNARRGDLAQALGTAIDALANSTLPKRRVVVFSDFQTSAIDRGAWAALAQKAAATGRGVSVELRGPAASAQSGVTLPNLAITDVRAKSDVWIENRPVPFVVRVANQGLAELPSVVVRLTVDGRVVATRTLGMGPRSATEVELEALFPHAGEVSGAAEVEAHDVLPDDDRRLFALRLRDSIKVVVVEEKLGEKASFFDQGYYVRMALEPRARGEAEAKSAGSGNYIQVLSTEAAHATAEMYRSADLIVLAGITTLSDAELGRLEDAVRKGKNLIVFVGRADGRLNDAFYNGPFWKGGLGLLPARPGPVYEGNRLENKFDKFGDFNIKHPLFSVFTGENDAYLRMPRFYRHDQPNPADLKIGSEEDKSTASAATGGKPAELRPAGTVLASFTGDGGPAALARPFGKGTVLMFPFVPRPESTDLQTHKVFVPLLHQAVRWLAGVQSAARRSLLAGEPFDFADAGAPPDAVVLLEKPPSPNGTKETLNVNGTDHPIADQKGIYVASFTKNNIQERTLWAVNLDPRESDLATESTASLQSVFATQALPDAPHAALVQIDDEQKALAPEWRWCLLAALLCLVLEVALRDFWKS